VKLRILVITAVVVAVGLVPATAWAKGAKNVTITGPGLRQPVHVEDAGGSKVVSVHVLAQATGLYHAAFRTTPTPMTATRPIGKLGPRYRAVYALYASGDTTTRIRQHLYPFAKAGFVTYTPAGQRAFDGTVSDGWYVLTKTFNGIGIQSATAMFVELGAPDRSAAV
jgi:hypothetical protein